MSNERVTAISFMINGRQAEQTLDGLKKRAEDLRRAIDEAQASGDSKKVESLNKQLGLVDRQIAIINRNVKSVSTALDYLGTVTKEDVKYGMDYWKEQAEGLKIGSEEWEKAFNSYISYKADYEKILALERNPLELLLHYEMEWRDQARQQAQADYEQGLLDYRAYKRKMLEIDRDYYDMARTNSWISNHDAQEFSRQLDVVNGKLAQMDQQDRKQATRDQWNERIANIKESYRIQQEELTRSYENQEITQRAFEEQKFRNEIDYLNELRLVYRENSYDRHRTENEIQRKEQAHQQKKAEEFLKLKKQMEDSYFTGRSEITEKTYAEEYQIAHETLLKIVEERKQLLDQQFAAGIIDQKTYDREIEKLRESERRTEDFIQRKYEQNGKKLTKDYYKEWFGTVQNAMGENIDGLGKKLNDWTQVAASTLGALQHSITELVKTELEIQVREIEKRYEKEISFAEGNSYQVKKLEEQRDKELAHAKAEAQRKTFALQIASSLATTAQNAISAYGNALQIGGLAGLIMAPIAAAAAVAAGMIQIAVIKKQQQAAEASYQVGGYTKKGAVDEVAGIVHAGEWVAPKSMVESPGTGPTIAALERIRRGETQQGKLSVESLGLRGDYLVESPVTRDQSLSATGSRLKVEGLGLREESMRIAQTIDRLSNRPFIASMIEQAMAQNVLGNAQILQVESLKMKVESELVERRMQALTVAQEQQVESLKMKVEELNIERIQMAKMYGELSRTVARLNNRLDEPFVTVNTVTGDAGIQRAQEEYALLMRNKSPKSRRS